MTDRSRLCHCIGILCVEQGDTSPEIVHKKGRLDNIFSLTSFLYIVQPMFMFLME